jgi:uncharacterized protein (TIGR02145 family)
LEINTEYYIRAYATNSFGTSYGNEITCTLWLNQPGPQVTDADGNIYNSIKIGNQIWMKENLGTTHYRDGISAIPLVTTDEAWDNLSTPGYCWYNNDEDFKSIYGALYNWQTVGTGNLCPTGWHVPTDAEWTTLTTYLGGEMVAGGKLKETGTTHWNSPNAGATNQSGFTALPGGMRSGGGTGGMFRIMGMYSNWWTSTEKNGGAVGRGISETEFNVFSFSSFMGNGCSIRCLKDN